MKAVSEPARAWAWHVTAWALAGAAIYGAIWVSAWAVHTLGAATGLAVLAGMIVMALGTVTWWASGRARP